MRVCCCFFFLFFTLIIVPAESCLTKGLNAINMVIIVLETFFTSGTKSSKRNDSDGGTLVLPSLVSRPFNYSDPGRG